MVSAKILFLPDRGLLRTVQYSSIKYSTFIILRFYRRYTKLRFFGEGLTLSDTIRGPPEELDNDLETITYLVDIVCEVQVRSLLSRPGHKLSQMVAQKVIYRLTMTGDYVQVTLDGKANAELFFSFHFRNTGILFCFFFAMALDALSPALMILRSRNLLCISRRMSLRTDREKAGTYLSLKKRVKHVTYMCWAVN